MASLAEVKALAAKAQKGNTDLNPIATDPQTGYNTYELRDPNGGVRKVELWAASSFLEKNKGRVQTDSSMISNMERRMRLLFDRYQGRELDPTFAMDMVASNLSDEDMVTLYDQRWAFFDRAKSPGFWSQLKHAVTHPFTPISEQTEKLVQALPKGVQPYVRPIAHPIDSLTQSLDYVYDASMNNLARSISGDEKMTFHGLFATGVFTAANLAQGKSIQEIRDEHGYDPDTHTFKDKETGEQLDVQTWINTKAPGWVQAADFGGYFIDPLMMMAAVRTARLGARTVRGAGSASHVGEMEKGFQAFRRTRSAQKAGEIEGGLWASFKSMKEARAARSVESFASRRFGSWGTTVEDVERIAKGELGWGDYFKGVNMREIVGSKVWPKLDDIPKAARELGFQPKTWRHFEEVAMAGNVDHIRALMPKAPGWWLVHNDNIVQEGRALGKSTREIAEDVRQEWVKLYDPDTLDQWDEVSTAAEKKWASARAELDVLEKEFYDPIDDFDGFPLSDSERAKMLEEAPEATRSAFSRAAEKEALASQDMVRAQQMRGVLSQVIDTIPRHTWSPAFRQWIDHATGIEYLGEMGTPASILDRIAHKGARSLRGVMAYSPQRAVDVTDDFSHQQFRRLVDGLEQDVKTFTRGDAVSYYTKYLKSADDNERFALMERLADDVYSQMGFTQPQIQRIREQYRQFWGEVSDQLSITSPKNLTIMDPHLVRRLSRLGPKALEPNAVKDIMEKALRGWKKLAITRPAWFFRVVLLSEQPRLAMAGMPSLVTHPLIQLAASQVPGASKAARGLLGVRLAIPGWKSRMTLNYGMLDDLLAGTDMGVALGRSEKAAAKSRLSRSLGTLGVNGSGTTSQLFHLDDVVTDADKIGYTKGWAEILNNRLTGDELHTRFLGGMGIRDAQVWANSEAASAWRNRHGLTAGTEDLNRLIKRERKFFDDITRKDPEIISHINAGQKYHWKDLADIQPPESLPLDVFTGRLDRPGLALSQTNLGKLIQPVMDSMSSNPSFWFGRFPAYRLGHSQAAARYVGIYSGKAPKAIEFTAEQWRTVSQSEDLRALRRQALDTLPEDARRLWSEHVAEGLGYSPQKRVALAQELTGNTNWREANQALLEDMGVPETVVGWRVRGKTDPSLGSVDVVNFSLTEDGAQTINNSRYQGGGVVEQFQVNRSDILGFGAGGTEAEFMAWRKDLLPVGQGKGITDPTASMKRIVEHAQGKPVTLTALEKRIADWSHQTASQQVRQVLYDLNESSRVADMGRFIAPFGNAWQEEITRWASLTWQRPAMPLGIMTAWRHKEDLPFSYKDPRTGDDLYAIPWSQEIVKAATGRFNPITGAPEGIAMPLTGRWKNLSIITGSGWLPGGGPFTTLPAKALANLPGGLGHVFQGVAQAMDPYGGSDLSLTDVLPSPFFRAAQKVEDDPARDASLAHAVLVYHWNRTNGKITPQDEVLMEEQLRALKVVNAATQLIVGSGMKVNLAPKLREMVDYMKWAQHTFGNFAQTAFLERYGDEAAAYMVNLTKSMTGAPPSKEAEDMLLRPEMKRWGRSKAFWAVFAEQAQGQWDPVASAAQVARGDREARGVHELTNSAYTITGWYRYGIEKDKYVAALTRAGLTTRSQGPLAEAMKAIFEKKRQAIFDAYPGFQKEFEAVDYNAWRQNMRDLHELTKDPISEGLQTTKGAQAFFAEARKLVPALRAAGFASLSAKEAEPFRNLWNQRLSGLFRQYPNFRLVYTRLGLDAFDGRDDDLPPGVLEQ